MAGCASARELQYLQAGHVSAAGFVKAMQSSTKAQEVAFQLDQRSEESLN